MDEWHVYYQCAEIDRSRWTCQEKSYAELKTFPDKIVVVPAVIPKFLHVGYIANSLKPVVTIQSKK